jgi:hypothetical protein
MGLLRYFNGCGFGKETTVHGNYPLNFSDGCGTSTSMSHDEPDCTSDDYAAKSAERAAGGFAIMVMLLGSGLPPVVAWLLKNKFPDYLCCDKTEGPPGFELGNAKGDNATRVNGTFVKTDDVHNGKAVYQKVGDEFTNVKRKKERSYIQLQGTAAPDIDNGATGSNPKPFQTETYV